MHSDPRTGTQSSHTLKHAAGDETNSKQAFQDTCLLMFHAVPRCFGKSEDACDP